MYGRVTQTTIPSNLFETYAYDADNNLTSKTDRKAQTVQYVYDALNRLTQKTYPDTTNVSYIYYLAGKVQKVNDPTGTYGFAYYNMGWLIWTTTTYSFLPNSPFSNSYVYDGSDTIEEVDQNGNVLARYSRTLNVDEPLAESRSGTTSYYEQDGLGSVTSLTNAAGALAQTYTLDSFGKQTASSGSLTNPFRYTGRELDSETGLYYYRARYYDANAGRFLGEDPIAFLAGTNFYTYVENDPVGWADPTGQQKCKKSCGIKKGPEYNVSGTVPGGTAFTFHSEFLNDDEHSPSCCEVRQLISWTQGGPPNHAGFQPPGNFQSGQWYEDRSAQNCRYGRRNAPYACLGPNNSYDGNQYNGGDQPNIHHHVLLGFRLIVVDICQGGKTIYTSKTIHVQF